MKVWLVGMSTGRRIGYRRVEVAVAEAPKVHAKIISGRGFAVRIRVACDVVCYDDGERPPAPPRVTGSAHGAELTLTASDGNRFAAYHATPERPTGTRIVLLPITTDWCRSTRNWR